MEHTYHYTLNKGRWAIGIFLTARIDASASQDNDTPDGASPEVSERCVCKPPQKNGRRDGHKDRTNKVAKQASGNDTRRDSSGPGLDLDLTEYGSLLDEEIAFLKLGILLVINGMTRDVLAKQIKLPVRIKLLDVKFDLVHYQSEGLACAMAGWLAEEFGVPTPQIPATFDRTENRYVFDFPQL